MKFARLVIPAFSLLIASHAQAADLRKPCEELRAEIAAKIEAKGVKAYRIDIIDADADSHLRTIGTCNGSTQRLVYERIMQSPAEIASVNMSGNR